MQKRSVGYHLQKLYEVCTWQRNTERWSRKKCPSLPLHRPQGVERKKLAPIHKLSQSLSVLPGRGGSGNGALCPAKAQDLLLAAKALRFSRSVGYQPIGDTHKKWGGEDPGCGFMKGKL